MNKRAEPVVAALVVGHNVRMNLRALAAGLLMCGAATVHAHPGHGATDSGSALHYWAEPMHAGLALAAGAVLLAAAMMVRRRRLSGRSRGASGGG